MMDAITVLKKLNLAKFDLSIAHTASLTTFIVNSGKYNKYQETKNLEMTGSVFLFTPDKKGELRPVEIMYEKDFSKVCVSYKGIKYVSKDLDRPEKRWLEDYLIDLHQIIYDAKVSALKGLFKE